MESQIRKKQKQIAAYDKEIQRLIRAAIAASNKAAGKGKAAVFTLTPEAQLMEKTLQPIKANSVASRTRVVTLGFGTQTHPVVKTTKIQSNGVTIATPDNAQVRQCLKAKSCKFFRSKEATPEYSFNTGISLRAIQIWRQSMSKKDKPLRPKKYWKSLHHPSSGKSELKFSVFQNTTPVNPKAWVYRM